MVVERINKESVQKDRRLEGVVASGPPTDTSDIEERLSISVKQDELPDGTRIKGVERIQETSIYFNGGTSGNIGEVTTKSGRTEIVVTDFRAFKDSKSIFSDN